MGGVGEAESCARNSGPCTVLKDGGSAAGEVCFIRLGSILHGRVAVNEVKRRADHGKRILISPAYAVVDFDSMQVAACGGSRGLQTPEHGVRTETPSGESPVSAAHRRPVAKARRSCICLRGLKTPLPLHERSTSLKSFLATIPVQMRGQFLAAGGRIRNGHGFVASF